MCNLLTWPGLQRRISAPSTPCLGVTRSFATPHPFGSAIRQHLLPVFQGLLRVENMDELKTELQKEFARISATEAKQTTEQIDTAIAVAGKKERFSTRLDRRARYWVDGLVIGSELFVKDTMVRARGQAAVARRRLVRAINPNREKQDLYCFRQLRVLLE